MTKRKQHKVGERFEKCKLIYEDFYDFELHEYNDGMWQAVYHNCEISSIPDEQSSVCFVHQLQRMMTDCYCGEDFKIDLEED